MARPAARWIGLVLVAAVVWTWWRFRRLSGPAGSSPSPTDRAPDLTPAATPVRPVEETVPASAGRPLRSVPDVAEPEPAPEPPPAPDSQPVDGGDQRWVEPVDGACPDGYPIKVNERSGIYHVPGGLSYDRTSPTRCYPDEAAATADGFRRAKR